MKRYLFNFIAILLILDSLILGCNGAILDKNDDCPIDNISPKDDAFHGFQNKLSVEWWYFDAIFDDNYGIHVGIRVTSYKRWGVVEQFINIYNGSRVEEKANIIKPLKKFQISKVYPDIKYNNKNLLEFDYEEYNKTGNRNYTITMDIKNLAVNLTFASQTEGFKYETSHEAWTVAQPKAKVYGFFKIDDKLINVKGEGYHDHNWNFSLMTAFRGIGWYWGKVTSENYTLTWAKIMKTHFADDTILENIGILNEINKGYTFINSESIAFTANKRKYLDGRFIPTYFALKIIQDEIEVNVTLTAVLTQRTSPDFLTIHYWRYFVSISGYIKIGENVDYLNDDLQIIEFMRFI